MLSRKILRALSAGLFLIPLMVSCGSDDPAPTNTGQSCTAVDQCYPGLDQSKLSGAAVCMDRVPEGYCTHHCVADTDCCKLAGECPDNHAEVCGPFESTGGMYCFLSCEDSDLMKADITSGDDYCHKFASNAFTCRSTGGGSGNRKVCLP
jgi:hypothetical protein